MTKKQRERFDEIGRELAEALVLLSEAHNPTQTKRALKKLDRTIRKIMFIRQSWVWFLNNLGIKL